MSDHDPLLFIDTDIFLDFYRATGSADFKLLGRLKEVHDKIISSHRPDLTLKKLPPEAFTFIAEIAVQNEHSRAQQLFENSDPQIVVVGSSICHYPALARLTYKRVLDAFLDRAHRHLNRRPESLRKIIDQLLYLPRFFR